MATETLEKIKKNIIVKVKKFDDEILLREIENTLENLEKRPNKKQLEKLKELGKPMRKKTDINEIIKEQNWKGVDREEFDRLIKDMNIQEPLEQLIADIGR